MSAARSTRGAGIARSSSTVQELEFVGQVTPGDAKEDWAIIRALSAHAGHTLPYDRPQALRAAMAKVAPQLMRLEGLAGAEATGVSQLAVRAGPLAADPFVNTTRDFYLTNPIARASAIMAYLSAMHATNENEATGTHG